MPIISSLVKAYAQAIYQDGTKRFSNIRPEYVEPTKQYVATNFSEETIQNALNQEWITQQEYDETIVYKVQTP